MTRLINKYSIVPHNPGVISDDESWRRDNLEAKGLGFLGNIGETQNPITELSVGMDAPKDYKYYPGLNAPLAPLTLKGHEYIDIPSVVPGLTKDEINNIQHENITNSIYEKAINNALNRQFSGKPVFQRNNEIVNQIYKKIAGIKQ
jgi:hypothetical protein